MQATDEIETVESIEAWSQATFGPSPSLLVALGRANEELSELISIAAQLSPDREKITIECADVAICLCRPAAMLKMDIARIFNSIEIQVTGSTHPLAIALGTNGHMAVLMARIVRDDPELSAREASRYIELMVQKLAQLCLVLGAHLGRMITLKMAINRARIWKITGEGIGRHIGE